MKARILSTKKLTPDQKRHLFGAGFHVVEQNFISIVPLKFEIEHVPENVIFTSTNAVRLVVNHSKNDILKTKNTFCVGEKTAAFVKKNGFKVVETAHYGANLAEKIAANHQDENFMFFCGEKRRPELPDFLRKNNISLTEVHIYDTKPLPKKTDAFFDGVLFFSPSAVRSYFSLNELYEATAFCIGKTTASEAGKYTEKIITATKPTVENVIVQVVKHFK